MTKYFIGIIIITIITFTHTVSEWHNRHSMSQLLLLLEIVAVVVEVIVVGIIVVILTMNE